MPPEETTSRPPAFTVAVKSTPPAETTSRPLRLSVVPLAVPPDLTFTPPLFVAEPAKVLLTMVLRAVPPDETFNSPVPETEFEMVGPPAKTNSRAPLTKIVPSAEPPDDTSRLPNPLMPPTNWAETHSPPDARINWPPLFTLVPLAMPPSTYWSPPHRIGAPVSVPTRFRGPRFGPRCRHHAACVDLCQPPPATTVASAEPTDATS